MTNVRRTDFLLAMAGAVGADAPISGAILQSGEKVSKMCLIQGVRNFRKARSLCRPLLRARFFRSRFLRHD
jgi:hypothetical protein